jgi:cell division protein FtsN
MAKNKKFFIYRSNEMIFLVTIALVVSALAFTLGIHFGKKIGSKMASTSAEPQHESAHSAEAAPDQVPGQHELVEEVKRAEDQSEDLLDKKLHEEVTKRGIQLENPLEVALPDETKTEGSGVTATEKAKKIAEAEKTATTKTEEADPKFTLQIGSFPNFDEAKSKAHSLEESGEKPFVGYAKVNGKDWYRVYVGSFETKQDAEERGLSYKKKGTVSSFVVSKMPKDRL